MSPPPPPRRYGLLAALCLAVLGALLPAGTARAASGPVQGGRLDWGIKSSFQSYVTGPVANGSYSLTGGAATVGQNQFRFHSARGTYDADSGAFTAAFSGGVRFLGHRESDGTHQLDLTLSNPGVRIAGSGGTLYVDIVSKARGSGQVTTSSQVPFATLSLGGIDMQGGGTSVVLNNLPATLTAQGARSFAGYYTAGTALDPVSLSADIRSAPTTAPAPTSASPTPSKSATNKPASGSALRDGAVDWGVRRTFREYVTGDIARGKWTLSDGAEDGGALFRFPDGEGTFRGGDLDAAFVGAVRFTGEHGLDLRLSRVRVTVADGEGTLYADVAGAEFSGKRVALVTFAAEGLKARDGLVSVTEAPAQLTGKGARAFGGMYRAGTAMDPVSLAVALTGDADLPPLPDLGSSATTPEPSASPSTPPATGPVASTGDDDGLSLPLVGLAALLVAAVAAYALHRRRSTAEAPTPEDD
ncbi:HtaA domain-containing protein [Streptomyces sp. NPDC057877]|uniref:HtaA domain-containing protein n=1 Tax=Streptomyces sp. NPDC057877 TaxID=3346269 RepID=UPI0036B907FE